MDDTTVTASPSPHAAPHTDIESRILLLEKKLEKKVESLLKNIRTGAAFPPEDPEDWTQS